jgi:hypothetical protein
MNIRGVACAAALALLLPTVAMAGPPFFTDDPEPVPFQHWEFYAASMGSHDASGTTATAPHIEVNYGPWPGVQLHALLPFDRISTPGAPTAYGYGDTELGVKLRFVKEAGARPEIGTFPLVELPTGNSQTGLGGGHTQIFIPLWIQKSWGHWSSYGGGGYWHNPGTGNRDWRFLGWELQRDVPKFGFLGGEIFHSSASAVDETGGAGFNIGGQFDFSSVHHILFSAGHTLSGPSSETWYVAYYVTL